MKKLFSVIIKLRWLLMALFLAATVICAYLRPMISVNYDMNSYLPPDVASTVALDTMNAEFDGAIPNARVMVRNVSRKEALSYKDRLAEVEGVASVMWLDDATFAEMPIEMYNQDTVKTYYRDGNALFVVSIEEAAINTAIPAIRAIIGDENAMTGSAVSTAVATASTVTEIHKIAMIAIIILFFVLILTTRSWLEPLVVMAGLGVAVLINAGSNLIFGEISFVTNAAGNILQLAVSLDYSVFLIHRFEECRREQSDPKAAMIDALAASATSILSSGMTTVIGFLALVMMRFQIGPDLGLALAKGIAISLLTVFLFMPGFILITYKWMDRTTHRSFLPSFKRLGKFVQKVTLPLVVVFTCTIVPAYIASTSNAYYFGASHIFGPGTQLGDDTEQIEAIFGKNDTYVLMVPKDDVVSEQIMLDEIREIEQVSSITSLIEMVGPSVPAQMLPNTLREKLESEHYHRIVLSVEAAYEGNETIALVETLRGIAERYYPGAYHLAGEGISTYDLMDTVTADMLKVNLLAIGAVFVVLLLSLRSLVLPVVLVLTIETAIWINLSIPYVTGQPIFYIAYLIISSIQLGATVDYAILMTDRYKENRMTLDKKTCIAETISNTASSILTSGIVLSTAGFLLGTMSSHGLLSQLGYLLGKGTICSLFCVLFVLPGLLRLTDGLFIKKKPVMPDGESVS